MKHYLLPALLLWSVSLMAQARYLGPVFSSVSVTKNITFGSNSTIIAASQTGGHVVKQPLVLDVYEPGGDTLAQRPVVLVVHGGTFLPSTSNGLCDGQKSDSVVVELCTRLAKSGYVAAAIDYRQGWNPASPTQLIRQFTFIHALYRGVQDARTAIRFFRKTAAENANPYRIDTTRIVLWGESTGGQVALAAAYANSQSDWNDASFVIPPGIPFIEPTVYGNLWGTNLGINPTGYTAVNGLAEGDTLCYPNWPAYDSGFDLCVSMGGTIPDLPWIGPGEMPAVLYQNPLDADYPCGDGMYLAGPFAVAVTPLSGSCSLAVELENTGNNQVFRDADINDCVTNNAAMLNGDLEGYYPFTGLLPKRSRPWQWVASCPGNSWSILDGNFCRAYIDTVMAYFAPRACAALGLCNAQPDPNGLCGTQAKGRVFIDNNQNGTQDAGEIPFAGVVIELQPGGFHAASGVGGNFAIGAAPGNYNLSIPHVPAYYAPTNSPVNVTVPVGADLIQNVGLFPAVVANDLQVTLTSVNDPRPGFSHYFSVVWKNVGTTVLSGTVTLAVDPQYITLEGVPIAQVVGNTAVWTFSNLAPQQTQSALLHLEMPFGVALGTQLTSSVSVEATGLSDENPVDNVDTLYQTVIGSFDPNDKRVIPAGDITENRFLESGGWLDYTLRFQNTGTASAINIHLVDTLSALLDVASLQVLGASHPMRWEIQGKNTLVFYFDNIELPDSLHNEPGSHGYVRYRIQPAGNFTAMLGKTVSNYADIYFDFNAPVRTNTTLSEYVLVSGTQAPEAPETVVLTPNPAANEATVTWYQSGVKSALIQLIDASGKVVATRKGAETSGMHAEKFDLRRLPSGVYTVRVFSGAGALSGTLIKR